MILVLGGTSEANQISRALTKRDQDIIVSCTTSHGKELVNDQVRTKVITGEMDFKKLVTLLNDNDFNSVIDATHPFAEQITENALKACDETATPYYRFERKPFELNNNPLVHECPAFEEAAETAFNLGKNIFLTIGVKNIKRFTGNPAGSQKTIIARILNKKDSLKICLDAGVKKENIITGKGPFNARQNIDHFKKFNADVVVSKESGKQGGLNEKIEACRELNIPVVLVNRPTIAENAFYEIDELLKEVVKNG